MPVLPYLSNLQVTSSWIGLAYDVRRFQYHFYMLSCPTKLGIPQNNLLIVSRKAGDPPIYGFIHDRKKKLH